MSVTVPTLDDDTVLRLECEIGLAVIDDYYFFQRPAQFGEIFDVGVLEEGGVLPVKPVGKLMFGID
jgi:hypothetical protein